MLNTIWTIQGGDYWNSLLFCVSDDFCHYSVWLLQAYLDMDTSRTVPRTEKQLCSHLTHSSNSDRYDPVPALQFLMPTVPWLQLALHGFIWIWLGIDVFQVTGPSPKYLDLFTKEKKWSFRDSWYPEISMRSTFQWCLLLDAVVHGLTLNTSSRDKTEKACWLYSFFTFHWLLNIWYVQEASCLSELLLRDVTPEIASHSGNWV